MRTLLGKDPKVIWNTTKQGQNLLVDSQQGNYSQTGLKVFLIQMEGTPFDLRQILFNYFATKVMKDKSIRKDIYHSVILIKVFEVHGVMRKFMYETFVDVQDQIYLDELFIPKQKSFSQENISKMRLANVG